MGLKQPISPNASGFVQAIMAALGDVVLSEGGKLHVRWLKTVSSTWILMGRFYHSFNDTTIMVSKNCPSCYHFHNVIGYSGNNMTH